VAGRDLDVEFEFVTLNDWVMKEPLVQLLSRENPTEGADAERWAIMYLAGPAAEELISGEPSTGSHDDRVNARNVMKPFSLDSEALERSIVALTDEASRLVQQRRPAIEAFARKLVDLPEGVNLSWDEAGQFLDAL
jgi:hypothetical protein